MTRPQHSHRDAHHLKMAAYAFAAGFSSHAQTSSALGLLTGTLAVCTLAAQAIAPGGLRIPALVR
ncbi:MULTISPECIES: hypothetical protein [unclassified Cupriavidus]|uniref:hypothetical protein n=1 Tax=unclassified Cupriavidus TaxID=2640874 RepID=UPI0010F76809|nr:MULTISPECIES: hypothetical protein [unclassified Cupriavidus]MWL91095.1 hypothetical protein [Cupriavidus sp. SW-Y-13]